MIIDVDGEPARLCGVIGEMTPEAKAATIDVIRAARQFVADMPGCPNGKCDHLDQFHVETTDVGAADRTYVCAVRHCDCGD